MRRILFALALLLSFALPSAARADSYHYTIDWNLVTPGPIDLSPFVGTYSFTVDSLLYGDTYVYGPNLPTNNYPVNYVFAADYTIPAGSTVSEIQIDYYPDYTPYNNFGQKTLYGVGLDQTIVGYGTSTTLIQDPSDPNKFFADYGRYGTVSMQITPVSTASPVPEPSTIALLGIGFIATGTFARRRRTCTSGSTL